MNKSQRVASFWSRAAAVLAAAMIGLLAASNHSYADAYPSKPIRLVIPFPAGGAADNVGRLVGKYVNESLGQPVVMDNRPGASGIIGASAVAHAAPDGYTLLLGAGGPLSINIQIVDHPPYDPLRDFAPITIVTFNDGILVVNPSFPAKSFNEFIELVRKNPGKYTFASSGPGGAGYLSAELLKRVTGIDMLHVPYKGDAPAIVDVMAGMVPIMPTNLAAVAPYIRSGRLRPVVAMGAKRFPTLPDLPTVAESGYPGFSASAWLALLAPPGTPPDIVRKLNRIWHRAVATREVSEKLIQLGSRPVATTDEELRAHISNELKKWAPIVRGMKASAS